MTMAVKPSEETSEIVDMIDPMIKSKLRHRQIHSTSDQREKNVVVVVG